MPRRGLPEHTVKLPHNLKKYITRLSKSAHTCLIFTGKPTKVSSPIVVGHNGFCGKDTCVYSKASDNISMCQSVHAEEDAITRYKQKVGRQRKRSVNLFVGRSGFKYSRPCWNCYNMLINTVRESYIISKIFYTNGSTTKMVKTSLAKMAANPFRVSSFWSRNFQPPTCGAVEVSETGVLFVFIDGYI